jgi:WD40 repeat protein
MVDMKAKNVSDDSQCHTDDITSITISSDRRLAASGQVGASPAAFVWDAQTGQKKQRFKLPKGSRGIDSIAMSQDGTLVAMVDRHDQHNVYVFDVASGQLVGKETGDVNKIFDICFSAQAGENKFVTAGVKHIKFWDANPLSGKKGIFAGAGDPTSFACVAYADNGLCFAGGANGLIYVWNGSALKTTLAFH